MEQLLIVREILLTAVHTDRRIYFIYHKNTIQK